MPVSPTSDIAPGKLFEVVLSNPVNTSIESSVGVGDIQYTDFATTTTLTTSIPTPTFGQSITLTATVTDHDPAQDAGTGSVTFYDGTTVLGTEPLVSGVATLTTADLGAYAYAHELKASYTGQLDVGENFDPSTSPVLPVTIGPATQTINFGALAELTYGAAPISLSATASSGEAISFSVVSGPATIADDLLTITGAGTVVVEAAARGDSDNDAVSLDESFTVDPAPLTFTVDNQTMVYGGTLPTLTGSFTSGFVNGDNDNSLTALPTLSTVAAGSHAGSYAIVADGAVDPNYTFIYVNGTLSITPARLAINVDDQSMVYGGTLPALTATFTGLVNGDTPSMVTGLELATVPASSHAGRYAITASGAADSDYSITLVAGTLTIMQAPLTITADDQSMVVGGMVPPLSASYSGLVNGDTAASLTTPPTLSTAVTSASPIGFYLIAPSGAVDPDYAINYVDGTLNVAAESPTITLASSIDEPVYGQSVTFTATVSGGLDAPTGSVQFEIDGVDSGASVRLSDGSAELTTATLSAGDHVIAVFYTSDSTADTDGSNAMPFMQIVGLANSVTTVADAGGTYNGSAFDPTSGVTGAGGLSTTATSFDYYDTDTSTDLGSTAPINAGHYTVTATYDGDANHLGSTSGAVPFIIGQADATVSVTGYTGIYDGAYHGATGSESGLGGENAGTLTLGASFENAPGGTAQWVFTGNGNYKDQSGDVTIAIGQAMASITVTPYNVPYDTQAHRATGTATGVESPSPANLGSLLNLSGTTHTTPGTFIDAWTFAGNTNYASASGTVIDIIAPHPISVTSVAPVSPSPRNSVVSSVDVTFSAPINTSQPDCGGPGSRSR